MLKIIFPQLKTALILLLLLTLLTGLIYPLTVTVIAQLLFPNQANGSLIEQNNKKIGSLFIGQSFTEPGYFWGRPSATTPFAYNGASSAGSNKGPSNPDFLNAVKAHAAHLQSFAFPAGMSIPVDLVTASGSGLDPEISPLAAFYQVPRIAKVRHISESELNALIESHIQNRTFGILGEPRVNVLLLNLALDLRTHHDKKTP